MQKILNLRGLGTAGRQNELIEMSLTYRFDAVEIDMADVLGRDATMGRRFALQFLQSAKTRVGTFRLPISCGADEDSFQRDLVKLFTIIELAQELKCPRCYLEIEAGNDTVNFQENFETHRRRLHDVAQRLQDAGIRLGLALQHGAPQSTKAYRFIRSADELLTLIRMTGHKNTGLLLDTWNWLACGGTWQQIEDLNLALITETRLADFPPGVDPITAKPQQIELPGSRPDSFALKVFKHLQQSGYDEAVSIATHASMFVEQSRDQVVFEMIQRLNLLVDVATGARPEADLWGGEPSELAAAP